MWLKWLLHFLVVGNSSCNSTKVLFASSLHPCWDGTQLQWKTIQTKSWWVELSQAELIRSNLVGARGKAPLYKSPYVTPDQRVHLRLTILALKSTVNNHSIEPGHLCPVIFFFPTCETQDWLCGQWIYMKENINEKQITKMCRCQRKVSSGLYIFS